MMNADLVVKASDETVVLVVEAKSRSNVTDEWASALRRNFATHNMIPKSAYFLLALTDFFYLWKPRLSVESDMFDYKIPSHTILGPYLGEQLLTELSKSSLELLLSAWLGIITNFEFSKHEYPEFEWMIESKLYDSIKGGAVQPQAVS